MIRDFESWNSLVEVSQLEELKGTRVGIEAADFLRQRILDHSSNKEPLVPALGGLPLGFSSRIAEDLKKFKAFDITPFFVFSGLDIAKQDSLFQQRQEGAKTNADAWELYDEHQAEQAVRRFGESNYVTPEDLYRALQAILVENKLPFMVAPYSAWAQLAYLEKRNDVQAISGSSEVLLFECNQIITSWDLEADLFKWLKRGKCIADMSKTVNGGEIPEDVFVDACMLAGTHFLPTLPTLDSPGRNKQSRINQAIAMVMSQGRSGISVVLSGQEDPRFEQINYVDRYKRARLAVRHHPVLTVEGKVEPLASGHLPNDPHEVIGQRLPDEVLFYMSRGLINSRILTWRATSEIIEAPPMDGGNSIEYKTLVSEKLTPLRTTAINLLSSSLHNWYQHKDIDLKCWFEADKTTVSMKGLPEFRKSVDTWNVKEATFKDVLSKHQSCGLLGAAVLSLQNADFVSKTVSKKDINKPLDTSQEIILNSIWRFLALRDYVDADHHLTTWGKVLALSIAALKGKPELEEGTLLAVELIRLGMLNWDIRMFPYNGAPMRGEQEDRQFNLLVSRVAGLQNLRHAAVGFTGPLSQHLLGYNGVINLVRQTLRDLVEVTATHLFMGAFADRNACDLSEIAIKLPFLLPNNCALSIAVKSYLDELYTDADPTSSQVKERVRKMAATRYFPQSVNLIEDLDTAFALWDAVYDGVKNSGTTIKEPEKKQWTEANEWLSARR